MTFRKLLTAVPIAGLVAVLAHLAGFGSSHALGGIHGPALLTGIVLGLVVLLTAGVWAGFARADRSLEATAGALLAALPGRAWGLAAMLTAGGLAGFAGIEMLEGRAGPVPLIVPAAAALAALGLAFLAPLVARCLSRAGRTLAAWLAVPRLAAPVPVRIPASRRPAATSRSAGARRGRAPPHNR